MAYQEYMTYKGRRYKFARMTLTAKEEKRFVVQLRKMGYSTVVKRQPKETSYIYAVTRNSKGGYSGHKYYPEATMKIYDEKHMKPYRKKVREALLRRV